MAAVPAASPRESAPPPALGGRLSAVSLFDLCQFLLLNRKTGNLTVRSGGAVAYLVFSEGQLMTATDDGFRDGEAVVQRALQWTDGSFDFAPGPVSPVQKIQSSTDAILLEAARQIDEMSAASAAASGETSAEAAFREKQRQAASLTEAFRSAVADSETARRRQGWKEACMDALAEPGALRLLLGPGSRAVVIGLDGVREISGVPASELEAWIEEIAPRPAGSRGASVAPVRRQNAGRTIFWSTRHASPEGEWLSVGLAREAFPEWSALGLPESLYPELQSPDGVTLLLSGGLGSTHSVAWPGTAALAAWLSRRAAAHTESAWVVETLPRYDWTSLPGNVRSIAPARLRKPGALEDLCRASGASLLALVDTPGALLAASLHLAAEGVRVVLVGAGTDAAAWIRAADQRLSAQGWPARALADRLAAVWAVQSASPPAWLPFSSRFDTPRPRPDGSRSALVP